MTDTKSAPELADKLGSSGYGGVAPKVAHDAASTIRTQADEIERLRADRDSFQRVGVAAQAALAKAEKERDEALAKHEAISEWLTLDSRKQYDRLTALSAALAKAKDALARWGSYGCPDCGGDCASANPPVACCIMQETRATLASIDAGEEHPDSVRLVHDAKAWKMVAQTMERSRDDVRSALKELLDAYSAYFPPGNPWGDKARKTLGINAPVFEGHDPTNPFAPRERPKKSIRLMTDAERRAAGLDPNGGFDGPTGAD